MRKWSITSVSIPLLIKVSKAFSGVFTIGSPRTLKDVFMSTGVPVAQLLNLRHCFLHVYQHLRFWQPTGSSNLFGDALHILSAVTQV